MQYTNRRTITGAVHLLLLAYSSSFTRLAFSQHNADTHIDAHTVFCVYTKYYDALSQNKKNYF